MYPRISWELAADLLGQAEHTLGTALLEYDAKNIYYLSTPLPSSI
jgi:hypothetical protein